MPIIVLHVLVSLALIVVVLVQHGQGDMGAIFGGSSQTVFGGSGAGNFLTKFTSGLAILFMCTSLLLATKVGQGGSSSSVMSDVTPPAASTTQEPAQNTGKAATKQVEVPSPSNTVSEETAKTVKLPVKPGDAPAAKMPTTKN